MDKSEVLGYVWLAVFAAQVYTTVRYAAAVRAYSRLVAALDPYGPYADFKADDALASEAAVTADRWGAHTLRATIASVAMIAVWAVGAGTL